MLKMFMASLLATQAAAAPPPPAAPRCLTRTQFGDLGVVGAAMFVSVAQNVCRQHLRPGAFLTSEAGNAYVANMRAEGRTRLPSMVDAVIPMMPGGGPAASPTMMRGIFSGLLADDAGREWAPMVNPGLCRDADELIEAVSVMTPERTARFMGAMASLADQIYRMIPAPSRPASPAAAPGARPTPLAFAPAAPPASPGARPGPPGPPMPPFLCRDGE